MILPDFIIPSRVNQHWQDSGIDSLEYCLDKKHFQSYPYDIEYVYNNRGYRDSNWPNTIQELRESIWCVGDSFTVGIGSPREHTWPHLLSIETKIRTINVSMDGASNNWISRKALRIIKEINPKHMIIQWSYIPRRELDPVSALDKEWNLFYRRIREPDWPDCDRHQMFDLPASILSKINYHGWNENNVLTDDSRISQFEKCSTQNDIDNTLNCIRQVQNEAGNCLIIHSFIPLFAPREAKVAIESQISGLVIPEIVQLDLARDGHHYDIKTSQALTQQILQLMT